ncbi:unnamed protein product [Ilex paraguariensis]|uniref:Uncharacterized protein n=1 Tax=Ilex paraguariensis TaxID=185542 RepID=A0ABC8THH5_9AQUA
MHVSGVREDKALGAQTMETPILASKSGKKGIGRPGCGDPNWASKPARRVGAHAVERLASQVSEAAEAMIPVRRAGCAPWQSCQMGVHGEPSRKSWVLRMSRLR